MRRILCILLKYAGASIVLLLLFNAGLYLACSFDSELVANTVATSHSELEEQGGLNLVFSPLSVQNDNYVDARVVNEIISIDAAHPIESYLKARKSYKPGLTRREVNEEAGEWLSVGRDPTTDEEILTFMKSGPIVELGDFLWDEVHISGVYGKYWHGYLCVYRPLFIYFDIVQTRILQFWLYVALFIAFFYAVRRRFGLPIATIFCMSLLCMGYFTVAFSLQCGLNYVVLMVSALYFLWRLDKMREVSLFIFCVACVTNFVDYLTMPMLCLGVLSSLYMLKLIEDGRDWRCCFWFLAKSSGVWLLGYGGTWLAKWIQYDLILPGQSDMFFTGLQQCIFRTSRDNVGCRLFRGQYAYLALAMYGRAAFFAWLAAPLVLWQHRFKAELRGFNPCIIPFLIVALMPLSWYLLLANHTTSHFFFTYRLATLTMLGLLLALYIQFFLPTGLKMNKGVAQ